MSLYDLNVALLWPHLLAVYEEWLVPNDPFGITLASILGLAFKLLIDKLCTIIYI